MRLLNFGFYSALALGFGSGGGASNLDVRAPRVARRTTIANMIVQTTAATIRDVIHVSKPAINMGIETLEIIK